MRYVFITSIVWSSDPSSTVTTSISLYVWFDKLSRQSPITFSSLNVGIITETLLIYLIMPKVYYYVMLYLRLLESINSTNNFSYFLAISSHENFSACFLGLSPHFFFKASSKTFTYLPSSFGSTNNPASPTISFLIGSSLTTTGKLDAIASTITISNDL